MLVSSLLKLPHNKLLNYVLIDSNARICPLAFIGNFTFIFIFADFRIDYNDLYLMVKFSMRLKHILVLGWNSYGHAFVNLCNHMKIAKKIRCAFL